MWQGSGRANRRKLEPIESSETSDFKPETLGRIFILGRDVARKWQVLSEEDGTDRGFRNVGF